MHDESSVTVYPVAMTTRHLTTVSLVLPSVILITLLATFLAGCDRTESAQPVGTTPSSELKAVVVAA